MKGERKKRQRRKQRNKRKKVHKASTGSMDGRGYYLVEFVVDPLLTKPTRQPSDAKRPTLLCVSHAGTHHGFLAIALVLGHELEHGLFVVVLVDDALKKGIGSVQ